MLKILRFLRVAFLFLGMVCAFACSGSTKVATDAQNRNALVVAAAAIVFFFLVWYTNRKVEDREFDIEEKKKKRASMKRYDIQAHSRRLDQLTDPTPHRIRRRTAA